MSSPQLETAERGFSFRAEGPLDMRMDRRSGPTAADLVNELSEEELTKLFYEQGGEREARRVVRALAARRRRAPFRTTTDLASVVAEALPHRRAGGIHPATKVFQALRIAVNREEEALLAALPQAVEIMQPGAVLAVISFHSGEDRVVKQFLRERGSEWLDTPRHPNTVPNPQHHLRDVKRYLPTEEEIRKKPARPQRPPARRHPQRGDHPMSRNRMKNSQSLHWMGVVKWILIAGLLAGLGLCYMLCKNQNLHLAEETHRVQKQLDAIEARNAELTADLQSMKSPKLLERRLVADAFHARSAGATRARAGCASIKIPARVLARMGTHAEADAQSRFLGDGGRCGCAPTGPLSHATPYPRHLDSGFPGLRVHGHFVQSDPDSAGPARQVSGGWRSRIIRIRR